MKVTIRPYVTFIYPQSNNETNDLLPREKTKSSYTTRKQTINTLNWPKNNQL